MQILGKRSKILLIVVAIAMLVAVGVSFATWDSMSAVKAASGNSSTYANAKVGEKIQFGNYYQDGTKTGTKYNKQPITWIVVDKNERTGQLTLLSEKILASGSYFGNYYYGGANNEWDAHYDANTTVANIPYNQAYVDSTVRAYLNNLERLDMGGDEFSEAGYLPSNKNSTVSSGLLSSIGFSNQKYWTGQLGTNNDLLSKPGFAKRGETNEIYYQRPINNPEFLNRPATLGFYQEAFSDEEKSMIVPKIIAGYTGHRWPNGEHDISTNAYVDGVVDKIWLPSTTELNATSYQSNDQWTSPSDETGSTVFEYFKNKSGDELKNALKATRTKFAEDSFAMNYSIPVYIKNTTTVNTAIHKTSNSTNSYWTRSPSSYWYLGARFVHNSGLFSQCYTYDSYVGVRPCIILKY